MAELPENVSDEARSALVDAQEEARSLGHNYVGTEHLLLGLLRQPDSVAGRALALSRVSLPKARSAVEFIIGHGPVADVGEIGFTPRLKTVFDLAAQAAAAEGAAQIGCEHLLLGLVHEGQGIAAGVLISLGADEARIQQAIDRARAGETAPPAAVPEQPLRRALQQIEQEIAGAERRTERLRAVARDLRALLGDEPPPAGQPRSSTG